MFLRTRLAMASLTIGLAMSGVAFAQQTQPNNNSTTAPPANQQMRRGMMRRRAMRGMVHGLRQLNLTDQQRQQMRSIMQSQFQSTQSQRQELRQLAQKRRTGTLTAEETARATTLRQQLMQSRQGVRMQMLAVLTPDQKAKLEEMRKSRLENRGKFGPRNRPIV